METAVQGYQTTVVGIPGYVVDVHAVEGYVFVDKFRCVPDAQRVLARNLASFVMSFMPKTDGFFENACDGVKRANSMKKAAFFMINNFVETYTIPQK